MASSFFGLHVAFSGLNAAQASINTTAHNISNVQTQGYSKQQVETSAAMALRVYQRFGSTGTGVSVDSIKQLRDEYYDDKYWNNQSTYGLYEKKLYYMEQIQDIYSDGAIAVADGAGFSSLYSKMFNALDSVKTNAGSTSHKAEFISSAKELATYFNSTATRLDEMQSQINDEIKTTVDHINAIAKKIATINKEVNTIEVQGGTANELRDERNKLIDELSKIVPTTIREEAVTNSNYPDMNVGATTYTVKINGQTIVDNFEFEQLSVKSRSKKYNQTDIDGLYDVVWKSTGGTFDISANSMSGELKALFEMRDGNNLGNLTGNIGDVQTNYIEVVNPSITRIEDMSMPSQGTIWIGARKYTYSSFDFNTDADGNITSYKFNVDVPLSTQDIDEMNGKQFNIGQGVDCMGIPYYKQQMSVFLRSFAKEFNEIQQRSQTSDGQSLEKFSFFVAKNPVTGDDMEMRDPINSQTLSVSTSGTMADSYYWLTSNSVKINNKSLSNPSVFGTQSNVKTDDGVDKYDIIEELKTLQSSKTLFRGGGGDTFLQCIYADITVDTQEAEIFTNNYKGISQTIDKQRQSVSGVDEDEEALDLIKFQNAYNLSSKCISILKEMYDRLILQTGV